LFDDSLAFATSMIALVVGVAICASFVATTMGMTVNEDRQMLAVLEAIGFPTRSRLAVVAVSTQITTLCGALLGIVLGVLALLGVNALARATVASGDVAAFHPVFVPYAVGVAFLAGLIAVPYPLAVAARTTVLKEVGQ
jgi:putative ABC transport system permease protein